MKKNIREIIAKKNNIPVEEVHIFVDKKGKYYDWTHIPKQSIRKKLEEILRDNTFLISADQVAEEKGLLWRIKPKWAKERVNCILTLLRGKIRGMKKEKTTLTVFVQGELSALDGVLKLLK